jgi:phytoene dehydrogenase-like protein
MAPAGKSVMEVWLDSNYAYWKDLHDKPEQYEAEKQQVAGAVIEQLEAYYPGIGGQIEVMDVATPVTIERYTGNWQGAEAWFPPRNRLGVMLRGLSRTLPGLENFHMVGQWAGAAGGLPMAATSGRKLVERLCRRDGRAFVTTVPAG